MTGDKYDRSETKAKISGMVIDANDPISLNEEGENEIAFIKNKERVSEIKIARSPQH